MGCCESSDDVDGTSARGLLSSNYLRDDETISTANSAFDDERKGPMGDAFPTWVKDDFATHCYDCGLEFNILTERKHHCRRCRNVFCNDCSHNGSTILLFSITEDVRVCNQCFQEIPAENEYVQIHKPRLIRGENFKKFIRMGISTKLVKLRLTQDEQTLVYDDQSRAEPTEIPLKDIRKLKMTSLKAFEIGTGDKTYEFEADSTATQKEWMEALKTVIEWSKKPSLREKVDNERRLKWENARRSSGGGGSHTNNRSERRGSTAKFKGKYG